MCPETVTYGRNDYFAVLLPLTLLQTASERLPLTKAFQKQVCPLGTVLIPVSTTKDATYQGW